MDISHFLSFTLNVNDYPHEESLYDCTPNQQLAFLWRHNKREILKWMSSQYPDKDWNTYEGGIERWWGMGSVFAFELGLSLSVKYHANCNKITLIIK